MIRGIFALIFLGIVAMVVNLIGIPAPFGWIIMIMLLIAALYVVAVMFGLVQATWYRAGPPL
jgi:hypothetical protein